MIAFADLPDLIIRPLVDRPDTDWFRAPPGKWSAAQVVHHLAVGIDQSGNAFASRLEKPPMRRRPRTWYERGANLLIMRVGWFPPGRRAPSATVPAERPERAAVVQQFTAGIQRFLDLAPRLLPARRFDLFVKHPVLGDLTFEEWMRFHVRHATHHAGQIRERLRA